MIDNNIRTDYNKLRHLIRLDKKMGMNASIIQDIVTNGETVGTIKTAFPAEDLAKPDNFKSLLYYFGLLTIRGTKWGSTLLAIPNLTVREQLYSYLVEAYRSADLFPSRWIGWGCSWLAWPTRETGNLSLSTSPLN